MTDENLANSMARAFKVARIKSLATLIASITGLVVATSAMLKPRDDRATQQSYETLAREMKELNEDNQQQHDDLVSMRAYLDGYLRGTVPLDTRIVMADAGAPDAQAQAQTQDAAAAVHHATETVIRLPKPPVLAPRPKALAPPSFAKVKGQADLL
jgi:hypothetical protein